MWIRTTKELPGFGIEVNVLTEHGERRARREPFIIGWRMLDCTHPLQNSILDYSDVLFWEKVDPPGEQK